MGLDKVAHTVDIMVGNTIYYVKIVKGNIVVFVLNVTIYDIGGSRILIRRKGIEGGEGFGII